MYTLMVSHGLLFAALSPQWGPRELGGVDDGSVLIEAAKETAEAEADSDVAGGSACFCLQVELS